MDARRPRAGSGIIGACRAACSDLDEEPGTILLQTGISWAATQDEVVRGARERKPTQLPGRCTEDISGQADMRQLADRKMTDEEVAAEGFIASADLDEHVARIREIEAIGGDAICLQLIGSADPLGHDRGLREDVLPTLCD